MKKKVCTKCNIKKVLTDFPRDRRSSDDRTSRCKDCMNEYKRNRGKQEIVAFDYYE
jgi:hypothetical protein